MLIVRSLLFDLAGCCGWLVGWRWCGRQRC